MTHPPSPSHDSEDPDVPLLVLISAVSKLHKIVTDATSGQAFSDILMSAMGTADTGALLDIDLQSKEARDIADRTHDLMVAVPLPVATILVYGVQSISTRLANGLDFAAYLTSHGHPDMGAYLVDLLSMDTGTE